jgi:hypothetical protein
MTVKDVSNLYSISKAAYFQEGFELIGWTGLRWSHAFVVELSAAVHRRSHAAESARPDHHPGWRIDPEPKRQNLVGWFESDHKSYRWLNDLVCIAEEGPRRQGRIW